MRALLTVLLLALAGCTAPPAEVGQQADADDRSSGADPADGSDEGADDGSDDSTVDDENQTRPWADPAAATIRPGVRMVAGGAQCTSNFVFTAPNGSVYLGFAAHCVADGSSTDTDGCDGPTPAPLGTQVDVEGADEPARLVYSSWETMQRMGETDGPTCRFNDFAFVELDPADHGNVSPAMRHYGGPTEVAPATSGSVGDKVLTYGNTGLRAGVEPSNRREGSILEHRDGWSTTVYTATAGLPGDSGSAVVHGDGRAMGVLVTVGLAPYTASNGVTSLEKALEYAARHGWDVETATWELLDDGVLP